MIMSRKTWLFFLITIMSHYTFKLDAQVENRLSCIALVRNDSILLRWAPSSFTLWQAGIRYGYIVKRYTIARNGTFLPDGLNNSIVLTESPIRNFSEEQFEILSLTDHRASVIQEAIFGKESSALPDDQEFQTFMKSYEEKEVRLGFALFMCDMSPVLAKSAGLLFADKKITPGERYAYSVMPAGLPDGILVEPAVVVVDAGIPADLPSIIDVQAVFTDRAVRFRWPLDINKGVYSAFILEKSMDGKIFHPVSDLPLVNFSENVDQDYFIYTDSLENNNEKVWYRVSGISPFGETGPASRVISGKGIPDFSAYASIDTAWINEKKQIVVKWRVTESEGPGFRQIDLLRSANHDGPFEPVNKRPLTAGVRTFTDNSPWQINYYQVKLTGEDNVFSYSFPYFIQTEDNSPPAAPAMLSGKVDSSGIVTVIWKENSEADLLGYKVFRSNSSVEEAVSLGQGIVQSNIFHDSISINTLNKKIFYQVVAIDKNYNASDYSSPLELSRPDTIHPAPATIIRISSNAEKIQISFENSPSDDISGYVLYRQAESDSIPEKKEEWKILPDSFADFFSGKVQRLEYKLVTIDNAGNSSANTRQVYAGVTKSRTVKLSGAESADGTTITLKWEVPDSFQPGKTVIYRGTGDSPIAAYRTITGSAMMFADEDIELSSGYTYRVLVYNIHSDELISSEELRFVPTKGSKKSGS